MTDEHNAALMWDNGFARTQFVNFRIKEEEEGMFRLGASYRRDAATAEYIFGSEAAAKDYAEQLYANASAGLTYRQLENLSYLKTNINDPGYGLTHYHDRSLESELAPTMDLEAEAAPIAAWDTPTR